MPEIILEISLNRSSGVLASIVASLAQAGIELQSQKLQRASEGRGGWLTVTGAGESPAPAALAERLNGTRGVEKLMRVTIDGEAVMAEGKPLQDQIQPGDLAELSAGSDAESVLTDLVDQPPSTAPLPGGTSAAVPGSEDSPIVSESQTLSDPVIRSASESEALAGERSEQPVEPDIAEAPDSIDEVSQHDDPAQQPDAESSVETNLADARRGDTETSESNGDLKPNEDDPARALGIIRRRRRRRW